MKHVTDIIQADLSGELAPAESAAVQAHLAQCPECARAAADARRAWDLLAAVAGTPDSAPAWAGVRERTLATGAEPLVFGGTPWRRRGVAAVALAAGLALAVLLPGGAADPADHMAETEWGSGFWLDFDGGGSFSDQWLAAGGEGGGS